jgi:uncharacterized membrane protein YkvA (DUF1232 family)
MTPGYTNFPTTREAPSDTLRVMAGELRSYGDSLREFVEGYRGAYERSVLRAPDVYDLFAQLFADDRLDREARLLVTGVLAYFVAPGDAMPEDTLGPFGLLDDLYVAAHAFRRLRSDLPDDLLARAWRAEGDVDDVLATVYAESRAAVGKKGREALRLAGIG